MAVSSFAAVEPNELPRLKKLAAPDKARMNIAACELDEEIFLSTDNRYANLRVFDAQGVETPYLVRTQKRKKKVTSEHTVSVIKNNLNILSDNKIEIIFTKKGDKTKDFPTALIINTSLKRLSSVT